MNIAILILAAAGFAVSLYAYSVERKLRQDSSYKPACDINNKISCSRAFTSQYGRLLGVSNTLMGMVFYTLIFVLDLLNFNNAVYFFAIAAVTASAILAYFLYVKVKSFCLVCTTVYIINISLLLATLKG